MTAKEAAALDLTEPCGFSADELSAGLRGELVPLAADFVAAEAEYGVNAVFLAALAAHESGWGRHCFLPENIFGWGGKSFASKSGFFSKFFSKKKVKKSEKVSQRTVK